MPSRIKKGDTVIVLGGKDKGKRGKVLRVLPEKGKIVVEKINIVKKHQKATRNFPGGIIEKPAPIYFSKIKLVCPKCNEATRIKIKVGEGGRLRACVKCKEVIDKI